ncbi:hypothetical protein BGX21_002857, partial [Mortierella sp. AD011]
FEKVIPALGTTALRYRRDTQSPIPKKSTDAIAQLEQQMTVEFLAARNQYAQRYPSVSSLDDIIPSKLLRMFLDDVKSAQDQDESSLLKYINTRVYFRSRSIRCLGIRKHKYTRRPFICTE